jgi:hypothetical protein
MNQYVVSNLVKQVVPIYVNSAQWHSMSVEDIGVLSKKTIAHSFRHFSTNRW